MTLAFVTYDDGHDALLVEWLMTQGVMVDDCEHWRAAATPAVAEQLLAALVAQWQQTPVDVVLFPAGALGDELATRLAWRLKGSGVCQVSSLALAAGEVTKATFGSALQATLVLTMRPFCLSLARQPARHTTISLPEGLTQRELSLAPLPAWCAEISASPSPSVHPLTLARRVLAVGQGAESVDETTILAMAAAMDAEAGYSRARVMNGGFDAQRMIGISGHLLAPDVCIVAGASGAPAFSAGIRQSQFIVAINRDAQAPIFSTADVGIVDDWPSLLTALTACMRDS
ncbi:FAD-binding protein [Trabulsiella odontotermitis]|uniref:FAD-binding protein n=1 Tax=Trabulsiella odontotermitis TaxID=379893 RepID=UPI003AD37FAA